MTETTDQWPAYPSREQPDWTDEMQAADVADRLANVEPPDPDELVGVRSLAWSPEVSAALATNARIYGAAVDLLDKWGFTVERSPGCMTKSASYELSKIVPPEAVTTHHMGSNSTPVSYILSGDPLRGLTGPLANLALTRDGTIHLLGVGYQNHAGLNHRACWDRVIAGTAPLDRDLIPGPDGSWSANRHAVAIEAQGDGGADDFTEAQRRAVVAINAAFHIVCGWPLGDKSARCIAHKELTTRKPGDPVLNMGHLRRDVAAFVAAKTAPEPVEPSTPVVEPSPVEPVPVEPAPVVLRVATLNCKGYGGGTGDSRMKALADVIVSFRSPLVALTECQEPLRAEIVGYLPGGRDRWKLWTSKDAQYPAILMDSRRVKHGPSDEVVRLPWNAGMHGAVIARVKVDGLPVTFGAYHLPPNSVTSLDAQKAMMARAASRAREFGGLCVLAGDGVNSDTWLPGWMVARTGTEATYHPDGKPSGITDRIHVLPGGKTVTVDGYGLRKTWASDHRGVVVKLGVSAPSPL